jgi:hypothetical protein
MKNFNATRLAVLGLGAVTFFGMAEGANAASVWRGSDYLTTPNNGGTGFIFPGIGSVFFKGVPVGPGLTDTVIQRQADCSLPNIGSSCTIPIEMTTLSLISSAPVNIGGNFFDVLVSLNPANQSTGTMTINHQFADDGGLGAEGTFSSQMTVNFKADFVPVGGGPIAQTSFQTIPLSLNSAFWSHEPPPNAVIVQGNPGNILGDNTATQNANWHGGINPDNQGNLVGDFFPGPALHTKPDIAGHETHIACQPGFPDCPRNFPTVPEPSTFLGSLLGLGAMLKLRRKVK